MDEVLSRLPRWLSHNVVRLRENHGFTQAQLAREAGIPRSTIAHVESGKGNPSLSNLVRVAAALRVSLEELLARPRASVRLFSRADLEGRSRQRGPVTIVSLLPDPVPGMEMERFELPAGEGFRGTPHLKGTREYLYGLSGTISLTVEGEGFTVSAGELLAFPGDQKHAYRNDGARPAVALSLVALTPPGTE